MSFFRERKEKDAKLSMTRLVLFAFVVLDFLAVILGRDAATIASITGGGVGTAFAKGLEILKDNRESAAKS